LRAGNEAKLSNQQQSTLKILILIFLPPAVNILYFMESPQKLYKALETFQPGTGLIKEFNVNYDSPYSTNVCP